MEHGTDLTMEQPDDQEHPSLVLLECGSSDRFLDIRMLSCNGRWWGVNKSRKRLITVNPIVDSYNELLNKMACSFRHHLIKAESPNLQANSAVQCVLTLHWNKALMQDGSPPPTKGPLITRDIGMLISRDLRWFLPGKHDSLIKCKTYFSTKKNHGHSTLWVPLIKSQAH